MQDEQRQESGDDDGCALGILDELSEGEDPVAAQPQHDEAQLFSDRDPLVKVNGLDARIRGPGEGRESQVSELLGSNSGHELGQKGCEVRLQCDDPEMAAR